MRKGQLYLRLDIDQTAALVNGGTRAGTITVPITEELLVELPGSELRETLARYVTDDPTERRGPWLKAKGEGALEIRYALKRELLERQQKARETKEREAEEAEKLERRLAEATEWARTAPLADLLERPNYVNNPWRVATKWQLGTKHLEAAGRLAEAEAEATRLTVAARKALAAREALAEAEAEDRARERAAWIEASGSARLKRLVSEEIEHGAVYRDERLAADRPGWRWDSKVMGDDSEPRNPPESALDLLDEARATLPEVERDEAKLVYWKVAACDDDEHYEDDGQCPCHHEGWRGYAVTAEFLGRETVYGGPE